MSQHSEAIYWPIVISTLLVVLIKDGVHCPKTISSNNGSFPVHPSEVPVFVCLNSHPMYREHQLKVYSAVVKVYLQFI